MAFRPRPTARCVLPTGFGSWDDVFGDRVIATAILDRLLHHAITVNIPATRIDSETSSK
jgi:hypothetical protein